MMKPNFYKQYDDRWSEYSYKGDTIGASGCGPSAVANAVSVLGSPKATPRSVFKWICKHGYFFPDQGTAHDGIPAALKAYGIKSVLFTRNKKIVREYLKKNNFVVSLMLKGRWTNGGHYVLAYYKNGYVYISDSGSDQANRQKASFDLFFSQSCKHWIIEDTDEYYTGKKRKTPAVYIFYTKETANVRKGRGTGYKKKGTLKRHKKVRVYSYKGGWYRIYSGKHKGGYIHESVLSKYRGLDSEWIALTEVNVWNGYSKKNTEVIKKLPKGATMKSDKYRGNWIHLEGGGWVCINTKDGRKAKRIK